METSPIYQTKNQEALRIIKSVFDLCFYEISESERALLITQMRTEETEKIEYIQGMLDQGIPELFIRKMLCELLMNERIKTEYGPNFDNFN